MARSREPKPPIVGDENGDALPAEAERVVERVRERYGRIARKGSSRAEPCCSEPGKESVVAGRVGYRVEDLEAAPPGANLGLGCGAPIDSLALEPGEVVLDLGSGGGLDAFLAAPRVGPEGKVIGVDMTPEMVRRATENATKAGYAWVEFREGRLESLPVEDGSVDAVTSNCVINLVPDKARVFSEVARVLRPGGRLVISDVVLDDELPDSISKSLTAYVGCLAGAMRREPYFRAVEGAGLEAVEILRDVDFLEAVGSALPEEALSLMRRFDLRVEDVRGKVRSVTFRARKPRTREPRSPVRE